MHSVDDLSPCYIALLDSSTLHTEGLFTSPFCPDESVSIYSLINRFSVYNRRGFVLALNTGGCYECITTFPGTEHEYSVSLYRTSHFGRQWSHLLVLRAHTVSGYRTRFYSRAAEQCLIIREALSSIHSYNRLAASSLFTETPSVTRNYLDRADSMCDRLMELICGRQI